MSSTTVIIIALVLAAAGVAASGWKSAGFYSGERIGRRWIHPMQHVVTGALCLLATLAAWPFWPWYYAALAGAGVAWSSAVAFQGFINYDRGAPWIDPDEDPTYELGPIEHFRKLFPGRLRCLQLLLAAGAFVLAFLQPW